MLNNFNEDIPEPAKNSTRYLQSYVYCTLVLALFSDFYLTSATYFNKSTQCPRGLLRGVLMCIVTTCTLIDIL